MKSLKFNLLGIALFIGMSCNAKEPNKPVSIKDSSVPVQEETMVAVEESSATDSILEDKGRFEEAGEEIGSEKLVEKKKPSPNKDKPLATEEPRESKGTSAEVDVSESLDETSNMDTTNGEKVLDEPESLGEEIALDLALIYIDELDQLLREFVNANGDVNYAGLKKDQGRLDKIFTTLTANGPEATWSREEALAYWINLYNVATLKLIIDNYPTSSITKLEGGKPWDKKWIKVGERTLSLNNVENDIIRPEFKEPRIHFAVNCAAASCPPLLNQAFDPAKLDAQLEKQTRTFLNNKSYNSISSSKLKLSKIFDWYKVDFGDLKKYVSDYVDVNISKASVSFEEYDWALNKQ